MILEVLLTLHEKSKTLSCIVKARCWFMNGYLAQGEKMGFVPKKKRKKRRSCWRSEFPTDSISWVEAGRTDRLPHSNHHPHLFGYDMSLPGCGGATLRGTFHPVLHPPLFQLLLGKTCSPAGGGGATLGSTFHPVRPERRLHPLTVRHQAGKLLCENGTQQFTDYQQGKTETSSLQSINKGKWKLAVYRL